MWVMHEQYLRVNLRNAITQPQEQDKRIFAFSFV